MPKLFVLLQAVLFLLFFLLPSIRHFEFDSLIKIAGKVLVLLGASIILLASINLGKNLSPFPTPLPHAELVTRGLFKWIRHPIYSGFLLFFAGFALLNGSLLQIIFVPIFFLFFNSKASYEERQLREKFPDYKDYMSRTGRFFPKLF